jgi:hypothetical protein
MREAELAQQLSRRLRRATTGSASSRMARMFSSTVRPRKIDISWGR